MRSGDHTVAGAVPERWPMTVGVVVAAGMAGLVLLPAVVPIARQLDVDPGLVEYTALPLVWNVVVLALLVTVVSRIEGEPFRDLVARWWRLRQPEDHVEERSARRWVVIVLAGAVGVSSLRLWLIDGAWDLVPGPSWSINSPDANRGLVPFSISALVLAYQVLLRIPLTVFVEETLFRGWVQQRHGPIASGTLFAGYHLAQWWTIPALVPFGLALSFLRAATRSIWPGAAAHGIGNVVYAFSLR